MMAEENEPDPTPVTLEPTDLQRADDFKSGGTPARGSNDNSVSGDWYQRLQSNKSESSRPNLYNAYVALSSDPKWRGVLAFDLMAGHPVVCAPVPSATGGSEPVDKPEPLQDHHVRRGTAWLQMAGLPTVATSTVSDAMHEVAELHQFHPVRDYLNKLHAEGAWDGEDRLSYWLEGYLGAEADDRFYLAEVGRRWLLGAVARVMQPGCKFDYMLVVEGQQGAGKSTAAKVIAGEDYFGDELPPIEKDDVRAKSYLSGKWIVEVPELDALNRAEASQTKAFLTATEDAFIPKYGRLEKRQKRQCVFIATTNDAEYLKDASGGRRFWPVRIPRGSACDVRSLKRDRDQLLAQAVHEYKSGAVWWPDPDFERNHIQPQQERRQDEDPWESRVIAHLRTTTAKRDGATINEIAEQALDISPKQIGRREQNRIMAILQKFGWEKGKRKQDRRPWYAPDGWDEADTHGGSDDTDPIDL